VIRLVLLIAASASGCSAAAADHERLGDQAYREGHFTKALSEYQAAQRSGARPRTWAKAAAAAVQSSDLSAAVDAYRELAREDPSRSAEAAVGLERVARAAERQGGAQLANVARVILALRAVSPGRPLGRLALLPVGASDLEPAELLGLLPGALAVAPTAKGVDSLLLRYAEAQRATVACEGAVDGFRALLRRSSQRQLTDAARAGLAECATLLGQDALAGKQASAAERWFDMVLGIEANSPLGWRAQIGLGDARVQGGDALGAAVAYQAVLAASGVPDSLRSVATEKLNALGAAPAEPPPARP
jgi:tetratricopeptide (TPR) repeat protein